MEVFHLNTYDKITSFQNELSKQMYDDSIRQRNQVSSKFTPTLTILTTEIGGFIWLIFKLINSISDKITLHQLCLFLFISATLVLFCIATVYFLLCFTRYTFTYPSPEKAKAYIKDNLQYIGEYTEVEVLDNVMRNISDDYIDIAINNNIETTKHASYLNKCYIFIISTLVCMIVDFVLVILL